MCIYIQTVQNIRNIANNGLIMVYIKNLKNLLEKKNHYCKKSNDTPKSMLILKTIHHEVWIIKF